MSWAANDQRIFEGDRRCRSLSVPENIKIAVVESFFQANIQKLWHYAVIFFAD